MRVSRPARPAASAPPRPALPSCGGAVAPRRAPLFFAIVWSVTGPLPQDAPVPGALQRMFHVAKKPLTAV